MLGSLDRINSMPHWITEIYVMDDTGKVVAMSSLDPTLVDAAKMEFEVPESAKTLTAYEWCNIHGLWVGPTVEVVRTASSGETSSTLAANTNAGVHITSTIWTKLVAGVALIAAINV